MTIFSNILKNKEKIYQTIWENKNLPLVFFELIAMVLIGFFIHGFILGTFIGINEFHLLKIGVKMIILAIGTTALCAPCLYIFSSLRGSNITLKQFILLLLGMLSISSLILIGFAPIVWFFIFTNDNHYNFINGMNIVVIFISFIFGFWFLQNGVRYLFNKYKKEDTTTALAVDVLVIWFIVFSAVAIQMYVELSPWLKWTTGFLK